MNDNKEIEEVAAGWDESVVMICKNCGDQFQQTQNLNSVERIKTELKAIAKENLKSGSFRIITTSCLNICPINKIAIVVASKNKADIFKSVAVNPDISAKELFDNILKK